MALTVAACALKAKALLAKIQCSLRFKVFMAEVFMVCLAPVIGLRCKRA
jgi:hypothetical protein